MESTLCYVNMRRNELLLILNLSDNVLEQCSFCDSALELLQQKFGNDIIGTGGISILSLRKHLVNNIIRLKRNGFFTLL